MKDLTWIKTGTFAHRGLHKSGIPENTMSAFHYAVEKGFDIELDIRLTKDNNIVVFHDRDLIRLCNQDITVEENTYENLMNFPILNTKETIPLLKTVLETLPPSTKYLIELKPVKQPKKFVELFLKLMNNYEITYAIHSFDPRIVKAFKNEAPYVIRGQISSTFPNKKGISTFLLKYLLTNKWTKPDFTNYRFEDLPMKHLDRLYQKGHCIISYVARSQEDLDFVKAHYDNAVFEDFIPKSNIKI